MPRRCSGSYKSLIKSPPRTFAGCYSHDLVIRGIWRQIIAGILTDRNQIISCADRMQLFGQAVRHRNDRSTRSSARHLPARRRPAPANRPESASSPPSALLSSMRPDPGRACFRKDQKRNESEEMQSPQPLSKPKSITAHRHRSPKLSCRFKRRRMWALM